MLGAGDLLGVEILPKSWRYPHKKAAAMDVVNMHLRLSELSHHMCGDATQQREPTRIVVSGFPELHGTLLEQRGQAKSEHDQHPQASHA